MIQTLYVIFCIFIANFGLGIRLNHVALVLTVDLVKCQPVAYQDAVCAWAPERDD